MTQMTQSFCDGSFGSSAVGFARLWLLTTQRMPPQGQVASDGGWQIFGWFDLYPPEFLSQTWKITFGRLKMTSPCDPICVRAGAITWRNLCPMSLGHWALFGRMFMFVWELDTPKSHGQWPFSWLTVVILSSTDKAIPLPDCRCWSLRRLKSLKLVSANVSGKCHSRCVWKEDIWVGWWNNGDMILGPFKV